ncbi:MAG: hypothetical protein KAR40_00870 [Candidatus Sabulitectum sp.]|nr:hypothetical protein [Candidatus Sabulitectum sp.]
MFALILTPFLYIAGTVLWQGVPDTINSGDGALLEMSTRSLFSRGILLGPYSRFLFFHPGPLYFVLRYPFYMAMGQRNSSFLIVTALISMASLFGGWYIVRKLTNRLTSILFSAVFALFLLNTDKMLWLSEWNPHIIMFPLMLFTVAMAAVGFRKVRYLYLAVFTGSFVAQTHIGGIPTLAVSAIAALLCAVYPRVITSGGNAARQGYFKYLLISSALLLFLWAPPIYEEFTAGNQGNMTRIREFFEDSDSDQDVETAFGPWSSTLAGFELDRFARPLRDNGLADTAATIIVALRILFLAMGYAILRRRGKYGFLCSLNLICLLIHGMTFYSVSQIRGELHLYLIDWMRIIAPLSVFTVLASLFALIGGVGRAATLRKYLKWFLVIFIVYSSIALPVNARGYFRTEPDRSWHSEIAVQELSVQLADFMDRQPDCFYVLKLQSQERWMVMFGLMNQLEKQGYPICMEDNVWFVSTLPPSDAATRILHLGTLTGMGESSPSLIARYDDIGIILQ